MLAKRTLGIARFLIYHAKHRNKSEESCSVDIYLCHGQSWTLRLCGAISSQDGLLIDTSMVLLFSVSVRTIL